MLFKTRVLVLALTLAWALPAFAGEGCAMAQKGGCVWTDQKASYTLTEKDSNLFLAAVVDGCAGKRAGYQARLASELDQAKAGTSCTDCPFGIKGLTFATENSEIGATVTISGPKDKLDAFQTRFDAKMESRKTAPDTSGCGCGG